MSKQLMAILILGLSISNGANASLIARAGGMVYDDVHNITWAADANLFQTQAASNPLLVSQIIAANGGVIYDTPNAYDTVPNSGIYTLTSADFNPSTGTMTWWGAQAWVNNLSLGGVAGWTLPITADASNPKDFGYNITTSQMGDLFYNQLGGVTYSSITITHNANYNLFSNVQNYVLWLNNEYMYNLSGAWHFVTNYGSQYSISNKDTQLYAWAVRPGDVAAVPLPGSVWLFLYGLICFMSLKRRDKIGIESFGAFDG